MVMAQFQTHQKMLNLTVWEAQPDEKSVILQPLGGIVNANNLLQHESSHESNWEPLRTACKLAFGYCSLSFCGQITTTVDWLQLLNMFGNFICSYCRHNKLVGHILTGSAFLLDFLIVCATDTSWAPNRFPDLFVFLLHSEGSTWKILSQGMRWLSRCVARNHEHVPAPLIESISKLSCLAWIISRGILRCSQTWLGHPWTQWRFSSLGK